MTRKIREFEARLSPTMVAVIYYSGHAVTVNNLNVLLPIDIEARTERAVLDDGILFTDLVDRVSRVNSRASGGFNLFIVDACNDNPFWSQGLSIGQSRGLAMVKPPGVTVFYAADINQTALDADATGTHGLFTSVLLREMRTRGLEISALLNSVSQQVEKAAYDMKHEQVPVYLTEANKSPFSFMTDDTAGPSAADHPAPPPTIAQIAPVAHVGDEKNNAGWLGMHVELLASDRGIRPGYAGGVQVTATQGNGPADIAGLRKGDVILRFNAKQPRDPAELEALAREVRGAREVSLVILRDGGEQTIQVRNLAQVQVRHHPRPGRTSREAHESAVWN